MSIKNFGPATMKTGGIAFYDTQHVGLKVHNATGVSIAAGKLVAVLGFDLTSARPKIVLADADVAGHDDIYVTTDAIADGAEGYVYKGAQSASNLNTNGATAAGDPVYLDTATAGAFTHTAPAGTNKDNQPVGWVRVKSATVGQIFWHIGPVRKIGTNRIS